MISSTRSKDDGDERLARVTRDGRPVLAGGGKGTLTLVYGDPESPEAIRLSFKVSLRRGGEVLALAKPGDHLIIDPVDKADWRAKRVIALGGC